MRLRGVNKPWGTRGARAGKTLGTRGARAPQKGARAQNGIVFALRFAEQPHPSGAPTFPLYNTIRETWVPGGVARVLPASVCSGADGPSFLELYGAGGVARDGRELFPARRRLAWRCSLWIRNLPRSGAFRTRRGVCVCVCGGGPRLLFLTFSNCSLQAIILLYSKPR